MIILRNSNNNNDNDDSEWKEINSNSSIYYKGGYNNYILMKLIK